MTISSRNTALTPPCVSCATNGTINVVVEVDGTGYSGAYVYVDNVSKNVTDVVGLRSNIAVTNAGCNQDLSVAVRCANNVTVCGSQSTQIDLNGDNDTLVFDCTLACGSGNDLSLSQSSTWVNVSSKNVTVTVWSQGITKSGVHVNISRQDATGLIVNSTLLTVDLTAGSGKNVSAIFSQLTEGDYLHVWVDPDNLVPNETNNNNYLFRPALKDVDVYLTIDIDATYASLEPVIRDYIESYVNLVGNASDADVLIDIATPDTILLIATRIAGPRGVLTKPYAAVLSRSTFSGKPQVTVTGLQIEGTIAGVKRLINARNIFLSTQQGHENVYIDDLDTFGISVFDQLHTSEAATYFVQPSSPRFLEIVGDILNDNNFEVSIKPAKTNNVTYYYQNGTPYVQSIILRVKNVNTDFSQNYRDALSVSDVPVVFSGGIFSNLETWEEGDGLAAQMAGEGWDVWEIEMNGGPTTDCPTCPNYRYEDQVDQYWPASIAAITEYTGKNQVDYVGHSNGCRAALSALNNYSQTGKNNAGYYFNYNTGAYASADLPIIPVRRFVGVACPGVLNEDTTFTETVRFDVLPVIGPDLGPYVLDVILQTHLTNSDFASLAAVILSARFNPDINKNLITLNSLFSPGEDISRNLFEHYVNLADNESSTFDVSKINVSRLILWNGKPSDFIVSIEDQNQIYSNLSISNKSKYFIQSSFVPFAPVPGLNDHSALTTNGQVKNSILEELS